MRKFLIFLLLSVSVSLSAQERVVVLETETGNLEGTLLLPKKPKNCPAVLLISGSGPTDRDGNNPQMKNNSLKMLAESLCEHGIATLRFDKRGVAESALAMEDEADIRFETYINDAVAWAEWLSQQRRISEIFVAGHSEGSLIGMVAARKCRQVRGFISLSGAGFPADEILRQQLESQMPPEALAQAHAMIDTLKSGQMLTVTPLEFYVLFRPSVQPYLISWFRFDPCLEIATLKIPVLLINGGVDIQVDTKNLDALQAALPTAESVVIPTMNHVLKNCRSTQVQDQMPTYLRPEAPLNATLVDVMAGFVWRKCTVRSTIQ